MLFKRSTAPSKASPKTEGTPALKKQERRTIISVRHLRKVYQLGDERVVALGDINLEIPQGQIICIVGTSGSGKSTLLNQLAGLEKPTRGAVIINGTNISKLSEDKLATFRQRNLGFVFQSYNLIPTMTAVENVALPMIFKGVSTRVRTRASLAMLDAVGLKKRAHHRPTQMSGGQQQRVGIARAFVTHPKVIFADEPTGNLDTKTTISIMEMMVRFARRHDETLILVTHDPELADYADRVITLIDGVIVGDETRIPICEVANEAAQQHQDGDSLDDDSDEDAPENETAQEDIPDAQGEGVPEAPPETEPADPDKTAPDIETKPALSAGQENREAAQAKDEEENDQ